MLHTPPSAHGSAAAGKCNAKAAASWPLQSQPSSPNVGAVIVVVLAVVVIFVVELVVVVVEPPPSPPSSHHVCLRPLLRQPSRRRRRHPSVSCSSSSAGSLSTHLGGHACPRVPVVPSSSRRRPRVASSSCCRRTIVVHYGHDVRKNTPLNTHTHTHTQWPVRMRIRADVLVSVLQPPTLTWPWRASALQRRRASSFEVGHGGRGNGGGAAFPLWVLCDALMERRWHNSPLRAAEPPDRILCSACGRHAPPSTCTSAATFLASQGCMPPRARGASGARAGDAHEGAQVATRTRVRRHTEAPRGPSSAASIDLRLHHGVRARRQRPHPVAADRAAPVVHRGLPRDAHALLGRAIKSAGWRVDIGDGAGRTVGLPWVCPGPWDREAGPGNTEVVKDGSAKALWTRRAYGRKAHRCRPAELTTVAEGELSAAVRRVQTTGEVAPAQRNAPKSANRARQAVCIVEAAYAA